MSGTAIVLLVPAAIALALAVLVPLARRSKAAEAELEEELGDSVSRSASVNTLGLESRGRGQIRGNGRLVLTPDELRFRQSVPQRETAIPREAVTSIGTERTWLGKWVGSKLLCVRWRTPEGGEDAMAWQLRDLDGWLAALHAWRDGGEG